jgi:phosphoglycolate phosphatase
VDPPPLKHSATAGVGNFVPMANNIEAVVFDLDGTLIDSAADLQRALNFTLAEFGREPLALTSVRSMIGEGITMLVKRGFEATGAIPIPNELEEAVGRFTHYYDQGLLIHTKLYPGVQKTLKTLLENDRSLGVCTNKTYDQSVAILEGLKISGLFDVVTGGDTTDRRKPDPKPLMRTLEEMEATPAEAIFVGDSNIDVETAVSAGTISIHVTYGYSNVDIKSLGATHVIDEFSVIPQTIRELEAH